MQLNMRVGQGGSGMGHHNNHPPLNSHLHPLTSHQLLPYSHNPYPDYRTYDQIRQDGPGAEHLANGENDIETASDLVDEKERRFKLAELKTSVFDTYAVCAALLASFSCSTAYLSFKDLETQDPFHKVMTGLQQFMVRCCTIGAIHTMLVFMFSALYAKSALARNNYGLETYDKFNTETGGIRTTAFWTMYYTSIIYCVQVAASTFFTFPTHIASAGSVFLLCGVTCCHWHSQAIIKSAGIIFMPDDKVVILLNEQREKDNLKARAAAEDAEKQKRETADKFISEREISAR